MHIVCVRTGLATDRVYHWVLIHGIQTGVSLCGKVVGMARRAPTRNSKRGNERRGNIYLLGDEMLEGHWCPACEYERGSTNE